MFMAAKERLESNTPHTSLGRSVQTVEQNRQGVWEWGGGGGGMGLGRMAQCYGSGDDGEESAVWSPYGNHPQVANVLLCVANVLLGVAKVWSAYGDTHVSSSSYDTHVSSSSYPYGNHPHYDSAREGYASACCDVLLTCCYVLLMCCYRSMIRRTRDTHRLRMTITFPILPAPLTPPTGIF